MKKLFQLINSLLILIIIIFTHSSLASAQSSNTLDLDKAKPNIEIATEPQALTKNLVTIVFVLAAALAFFFLIAGSISIISSGGDKGKFEEGKNKIITAIIGLLILAATWAIFVLITDVAFGGRDKLVIPKLNEIGTT